MATTWPRWQPCSHRSVPRSLGSTIPAGGVGSRRRRHEPPRRRGPRDQRQRYRTRRHRSPPTDARRSVPGPDRSAVVTLNFAPPAHPPGAWATANTYAGRTIKQFMRTPQLLVVNALTSIMFLLIFRFVFGGAIQTGDVEYVNFLIPALAAVNGLFAGGAVGVAEDTESGLFDRLRSLPVPRSGTAVRAVARRHGAHPVGHAGDRHRRGDRRLPSERWIRRRAAGHRTVHVVRRRVQLAADLPRARVAGAPRPHRGSRSPCSR